MVKKLLNHGWLFLEIMAKKTIFGLVKTLVEVMLRHKAILNGETLLKLKPLEIMKK